MNCKNCKKDIFRSTGEKLNADGLCDDCAKIIAAGQKLTNDLLTAFGGTGKRGFVQWLKMGNFLEEIISESDRIRYNDRINVIKLIIGLNRYDKLIDKFADCVLELAKENPNT